MIRVILHGSNGKMGCVVEALVREEPMMQVVAGVDRTGERLSDFPVFASMAECDVEGDVVIDFSNAQAVDGLLEACRERKLPVVLCTTGLSQEQLDQTEQAAKEIAVLRSANMSLGINLLQKLLKEAASVLAPAGFDMEIVEKHHKKKLDAPSGTALALADSMKASLSGEYTYVYDRSAVRKERGEGEIGIVAVRGGTIVGEHDAIFAGCDEVLTFSHTAYSKSVFGKGAVEAAKFLAGKPAGRYDMSDVIQF